MEPYERIVFALDTGDADQAVSWVRQLTGKVGWFKVGLELFIAAGPDLVKRITDLGGQVFLDLKIHDIPATVGGALESVSRLGVGLATVHIQTGRAWREAVKRANGLKILGVSVLTSQNPDDLAALDHCTVDPSALVGLRAELAREAELDGLVCSGREAGQVRKIIGRNGGLIVCPGIRPAWSVIGHDDQARVTTPVQAVEAGADLIVVGRPIRTAPDMAKAADKVAGELAEAKLP